MIIASGTSDRHVRSIADHVVQQGEERPSAPTASKARVTANGARGPQDVAGSCGCRGREFYALEQL
jgi:ribosomal silencing factor RsfS